MNAMTRRLWLPLLCAMSFTGAPTLGEAQDAAAPNGRLPGRVVVTGENPGISLLDKQEGTTLTNVSYWRIVWSPVGAGHICYLTTGDGKSGDLRLAFVDNQRLYDLLTKEIMVVIDPSVAARPFSVVQATFNDRGEGTFNANGVMQERTVTLKSASHAVSLVWRDFTEPYQIHLPVGQPPNRFTVTSLFIPAKSADVTINGTKAAGKVFPSKGFAPTTAFLAFSESWLK
jgi:hypothetical protein